MRNKKSKRFTLNYKSEKYSKNWALLSGYRRGVEGGGTTKQKRIRGQKIGRKKSENWTRYAFQVKIFLV